MTSYCTSEDSCLRKKLDLFGFSSVKQDRCCCMCDGKYKQTGEDLAQTAMNKVRFMSNNNRIILERSIKSNQQHQVVHTT